MSAIPQAPFVAEKVTAPLRQVARRRWRLAAGAGLLQLLVACLTVWLAAALVIGAFSGLPYAARVAIAAVAWGTLLASLVSFLRPALARRSLGDVAREVESTLPGSEELLSSAVELSTERDARYAASPELVRHVIQQAERAAASVDPVRLVPMHAISRWAMLLFPVLLCWAVLMPAMPTPLKRGLYALLVPWRVDLPAGLAAVSVTPGDAVVAEGDPIEIKADVAPRLRMKPEVNGASLFTRVDGVERSQAMARTGPRAFQFQIEHATEPFEYRVTSEDGSSRWYAIKVMPRPQLASVDARYVYPAYTKLPPKVEPRKDGTIEALMGTEVELAAHATQPLSEKSRLILSEKAADEQSIPLTAGPNGEYRAKLTVSRSTAYRIDLVNTDGLSDRGDLVRQITAVPDKPPTITITAPAAKVTAAPDDSVVMRFDAADDFGVAKVEAVVQVDGQPPETEELAGISGFAKASGSWTLSIPQQVAIKKLRDANRIEYQLKVTDNREPQPQVGYSNRQVIEIDHSFKQTVAAQEEARRVKELEAAIREAIAELKAEKSWVDPLAKLGADRVFSAAQKKVVGGTKDALVYTARTLADVAAENLTGSYADLAQAAQDVANGPIDGAAEDLAAAAIGADQPEARQRSIASAADKAEAARKQLEALLDRVTGEVPKREVARALDDMAKHERQLANDMAKPDAQRDRGQEQQRQQTLRQRLEELLNQNKDLNAQQAREAAQRNEQLARRVEQLQEQQRKMEGLAEKQQAVNVEQEKVNALAQKQKELNDAIEQFAAKEAAPVKDAGAHAPEKPKLENIVQALQKAERVPEGNQQQREVANQLKQDAQQLTNAAQSNDAAPGRREREAKQDREKAAAASKQAAELAKQAAAAKDAKDPKAADEQVKQKERELAQRLEQHANEMKGRDPNQKEAIEKAQQAVATARKDADEGHAGQADQQLADAAKDLAAVADAEAQAAQAERREMADAAKGAQQLAERQQQLADQTAKEAQALAQARQRQGDPQAMERGEQQAANDATNVANEAGQAAQQDQAQGESELSQAAADAQKAMAAAAQHEQEAAKAAHDAKSQDAGGEQSAAEQSLAQAQQALRGGEERPANQGVPMPPPQAARRAAAAAQEARMAEESAVQNNARAAAQAARALRDAAQAMDASARGTSQMADAQQSSPAAARANAQARSPGDMPARDPQGTTVDSRQGADVTGMAAADSRPQSVKEVGISASDWAKLPPLAQQQLLNAAQQGGPPGYQERIKAYFVKIAKIQAEEGK